MPAGGYAKILKSHFGGQRIRVEEYAFLKYVYIRGFSDFFSPLFWDLLKIRRFISQEIVSYPIFWGEPFF